MQELLKSKVIIGFAAFGAFFALIFSLFSGTSLPGIVVRIMGGALVLGGMGLVLMFYLKSSLSAEDFESIFGNLGGTGEVMPSEPSPRNEKSGGRIDIIDSQDTEGNEYEELYKNEKPSRSAYTEKEDRFEEKDISQESSQDSPVNTELTNSSSSPALGDNFKPDDVSSIPKVAPVNYDPGVEEEMAVPADLDSGKKSEIKDDLGRLDEVKKEETIKKNADVSGVKFRVGNKNITADPKVIADAIKTVLHRE